MQAYKSIILRNCPVLGEKKKSMNFTWCVYKEASLAAVKNNQVVSFSLIQDRYFGTNSRPVPEQDIKQWKDKIVVVGDPQ